MAIAKGASLGPYEVLAPIGAGGMGQVWRARDRRIGRDVAIKVVSESYRADDETMQRFEQEARAAGALNHPGLVTIYDVGTAEGAPYIVMELLDGETLRDALERAASRPLPVRKALDWAIQVAEALAVTHEKGIIHRDLKPENIFITTDRRVKILDFGLAKLAAAKEPDGENRTSRHLTAAGIAVGTPGYMSPEQVRAQPIDHRTDLFSLGSVLYEMLTGRSPFELETVIETMHAVIDVEPEPVAALVPDIPPAIDAIVRHCLEKNPRERFQSARDLAFQLRVLLDMQTGTSDSRKLQPLVQKRPWRTAAVVALATLTVAAGGVAVQHFRGNGADAPVARSFRQLTFADGMETFPSLAPDGKSFVFVSTRSGNRDIYVQRVDGRTAVNITPDSADDDSEPAFSPDGSRLAFRSERDGGGIFVMGVTGESVRRLTNFGRNPAWAPDGNRIVVAMETIELTPDRRANSSGLWVVDVNTGAHRPLIQPKTEGTGFGRDIDAVQPSWSPNGKRIAYWGISVARRDLWTIEPDAAQPEKTIRPVKTGLDFHWNPIWSPDGKYLYFGSNRDGTMNLWRIAIDEESGEPAGVATPLSLPASFTGHFAFSRTGDVAYVAVTRTYEMLAFPFDASTAQTGEPRRLFGGSEPIEHHQPAPDQKSIVFTTLLGHGEAIYVADTNGARVRQLTSGEAIDRSPTWSPDGKTLYFYSDRGNGYHLWSIRADGSGLTKVTDDGDRARIGARNLYAPNVAPHGRTVAVLTERFNALVHLDRPAAKRLEPLATLTIKAPKWSPDGQRLVGADDRRTLAGPREGIFVYSLASRQARKVFDRGIVPQWLPDGRRIVFFDKKAICVLDVDTRALVTAPMTIPYFIPGPAPQLSRDGTTLYTRRAVEQSDVWIARLGPER